MEGKGMGIRVDRMGRRWKVGKEDRGRKGTAPPVEWN